MDRKRTKVEQLIGELQAEGWKVQRNGVVYINGILGTHLYKDGQVLHVAQAFDPDEELIEALWPGKVRDADRREVFV